MGLVASHPLALERMADALRSSEFTLFMVRLAAPPRLDGILRTLPRADVLVVDTVGAGALPPAMLSAIESSGSQRVLLVADTLADDPALELMRAGARGFVAYGDFVLQLAAAVETVAHGGIWAPRALLVRALDAVLDGKTRAVDTVALSRREREVRDAIIQNLSNKEIATRFSISERTVKFHVSNLLAKFHVRRRADLILLSLRDVQRG